MLKRKTDPENQHEHYFETTLKQHYPKVYLDMIKNDYILTHSQRTQEKLNSMANKDFATRRREFLHRQKQLADVISGRHRPIPLSNPMRFLAEQHLENIARNSTASPGK